MKTNREIRNSYRQYLQSLEWKQFSVAQVEKSNGKCWACEATESLQVHHLVYRDVMPWEYDDNEVRVLCDRCHKAVHLVADLIWVAVLRFEPHVLEILLKRIKNVGDGYDCDGFELGEGDFGNVCDSITRGVFGAAVGNQGKSKVGFGPAELRPTTAIQIADDNLVCGVCRAALSEVDGWTVVSSPRKKGVIVFSCARHVSGAMNLIAKLVDGLKPVPEGLKLPDPEEN